MTKSNAVASDKASIRRVRKAIRTQGASFRQVFVSPEAQRDQWIARNPNIIAAV
jgi:hypothetical protein